MRTWLHLLLRASHPRLSRPVAGSRFRNPAVRQTRCGSAAPQGAFQKSPSGKSDRDGHQHRSLSTEIGRATCRERVCQYVEISVVAGSIKKKKTMTQNRTAEKK